MQVCYLFAPVFNKVIKNASVNLFFYLSFRAS